MNRNSKFRMNPVAAAVGSALLIGVTDSAVAQEQIEQIEEITVVGIRGSLQSSMNYKRKSTGVVDAIMAEDIGKFPDTNLAESLQRITGVSIDRRNGEGSQVTVRGFGPGFNLITLNGRTMPTATIGIMGARSSFQGGQGRSFGFENIASEGVSGLQVYKTGSALLPSGGIGATINIETFRPLNQDGMVGTIGAKAIADSSVGDGDSVTPELAGLFNWSNDEGTVGVGVFGSYSKRDSGATMGQSNDWVVRTADDFLNNTSIVRAGGDPSNYVNAPADGELYAIPQDSRYDWSNLQRERLNGQLVLQFRPLDNLNLTLDYTFVENVQEEQRSEQTNWFATPFDQIVFDGEGPVSQAVFMQENNNGTKDMGYEQIYRGTKETIDSIGFNLEWAVNDTGTLTFDAHSSEAEALPDNPLGHTATVVTIGAPVISQHSVDFSSGFPVQSYTIDDSIKGNDDGILNAGDLATQVQRSSTQTQTMDVNEIDLRYTIDDGESRLDFGVNLRDTEVFVSTIRTQRDLGSWGMASPGDVEQFAPGVVESYCLSCQFNDFPVGDALIAFRGDATVLFPIFAQAYSGNSESVNSSENTVKEEIISFYVQFQMESEFLGVPVHMNAGLRYEETDVQSFALQAVPTNILWTADNDFTIEFSPTQEDVAGSGSYSHLLPSLDFRFDLTDNIVARVSYSQTIGRVPYNSLFASTEAGAPNRPTVLGGQTGGSSQNPNLLPLESENFDVSFEYYYKESSYVSIGFFDKTVQNFLGTGVFNRPLFGLLDPTSGVAGSRSGDALDVIDALAVDRSEANLFTLVALIDANNGSVPLAQAEFASNLDPATNTLPQSYVDSILALYDISGDANDPLMDFGVTQPINDREGNIHGWELAWQHFFGDTGFGLAANYTIVDGDVRADIGQDPSENQFALVGLSDTANLTGIYEKRGWSARVSYNWRDEFLNATNQGGSRSPQFTDEYGQIDINVTYNFTDNFQMSLEGINLNGENSRQFRRKTNMNMFAYEFGPRYIVGARYMF